MKKDKLSILERCLRYYAYLMLTVIVVMIIIALFAPAVKGEANVGSFEVVDINDGWTMDINGETDIIDLPSTAHAPKDSVIILKNTLPEISSNYSLCTRASVSDMSVWINGEMREEYSSETYENMGYYIQSAYIITDLTPADSGAEIELHITAKTSVSLNTVFMSPGNGVWFKIIKDYIILNVFALAVFILGVLVLAFFLIGKTRLRDYRAVLYLSLVMIDMSLWMLSESRLRQLIFSRVSLAETFSYFTIELLGMLVILYFNEVQHKKYQKVYVIAGLLLAGQLLTNIILDCTGLVEMYRTLFMSHIWTAVAIIVALVTTIRDVIKKNIKEYFAISIGMMIFLVMAIIEMIAFYISNFHAFGIYVCIGLIILLFATVIQLFYDENKKHILIEKEQERSIISTIETITSSIDAKDEYTGGHSQRVGAYAQILAKEMAEKYNLSNEDILRIHYIGLVHDIGKMGVADPILNKPGRLTDEEFNLMKQHTNIGYELMTALGDNIKGLLDGIRYHHERFDGKGYPLGLSGTDIPLEARILCLADCYDAMTSNRVYRKRLSDEEVIKEINRCSGTQFDPDIADIFTKLLERGELVATTVEGMETDSDGKVYLSSVLEYRLHRDLMNTDLHIANPTFIRMLCYLVKMAERKNRRVFISFVSVKDENNYELKKQDIRVMYTDDVALYGLFDRSDSEIASLPEFIKSGKLN